MAGEWRPENPEYWTVKVTLSTSETIGRIYKEIYSTPMEAYTYSGIRGWNAVVKLEPEKENPTEEVKESLPPEWGEVCP